jgi:branched-chain amino acid transport system ATP-binding protein
VGKLKNTTLPRCKLRSKVLKVSDLKKSFGGLEALRGVFINVEEGKISSLIGPNGAGKTTLFNIVAGSLRPDSGKVEFVGEDITGKPPYEICRRGIARTYQLRNLFPSLTVFDNVMAGTLKDGMSQAEREGKVYEILEFLGLKDRAKYEVSSLSPLEMRVTELGRALAANPKLLLLDELLGGLLAVETEKICEIVKILKERGYTIMQIGHEIRPIMRTSDWIFVLNEGSKVTEGPPEVIKHNEEVVSIYLELEKEENA